jgi:hypothetical protein
MEITQDHRLTSACILKRECRLLYFTFHEDYIRIKNKGVNSMISAMSDICG